MGHRLTCDPAASLSPVFSYTQQGSSVDSATQHSGNTAWELRMWVEKSGFLGLRNYGVVVKGMNGEVRLSAFEALFCLEI